MILNNRSLPRFQYEFKSTTAYIKKKKKEKKTPANNKQNHTIYLKF